jgi:hypothetical protein
MKVFSCPDLKVPSHSVADLQNWQKIDDAFVAEMATVMRDKYGYTGARTGQVFRIPWADGYAQYMVAERGTTMHLVHVPTGDAWHVPEYMTRGLRKADILAALHREAVVAKLFARPSA